MASAVGKFTDVTAAIALMGGTRSRMQHLDRGGRSSRSPCTYVRRAWFNAANAACLFGQHDGVMRNNDLGARIDDLTAQ